ncbi:MAG TPA: hypothetical protein VK747_20070 [Blastocatellia bacterium]|nr:hypothetical protein [Blastocatellia bacterium]
MLIKSFVLMMLLASVAVAQNSSTSARSSETLIRAAVVRSLGGVQKGNPARVEYRLLATNKTSTMQKEMNQAADAGFRYGGVMGGETAFGGNEVVVVMYKDPANEQRERFQYRLLATSKTSTMQKEMQEAGDAGYEYQGQTIFSSTFGGREVVVILERDREAEKLAWEYKLLATSKTATMQKELSEAGGAGFSFVGVTVAETSFGGKEVVSILRRPRQ